MLGFRLRAASGSAGGVTADYVAKYLFDGDFTDESGVYDGTNNGATFLSAGSGPGGGNTGINVGGGTKWVSLPVGVASSMGDIYSISFAVKTASTSNICIILAGSDNTVINRFHIPEFGDGSSLYPRMVSSPNGSSSIYRGDAAGAANSWSHVTMRSDGSTTSFRLNGSNLGKVVVSGTDNGDGFADVSGLNVLRIGYLDRSSSDTGASNFDLSHLTLFDYYITDARCAELESEY